jgi:hypothetical protein
VPRQPTKVTFRGTLMRFHTSKEAYLWLVGKFRIARPDLLETESEKPYIKTGKGRRHFAKRPEDLYEKSPHLTGFEDHYVKLPGGWFADVHLDNPKKLKILEELSYTAGLKRGQDWSWDEGVK